MMRNFSMAASPIRIEPRKASGKGRGICSGPQMTLIISSPIIMPPMVIRICLRCCPYTGRTIKRSNASPKAAATAIPASMAGKMATQLRHSSAEVVQLLMAPSTEVATKAPKAMNTPWPKLSTSIRPNTKVRPEAITKIIMPMARPATVRVSQEEGEPTKGRANKARAGTSSKGFTSNLALFIATGPEVVVAMRGLG